MFEQILASHRGPYALSVTRPFATKAGFFRTEWLAGNVDADDLEEEARALLTDPRDTIVRVSAWSEREQAYVISYSRTMFQE